VNHRPILTARSPQQAQPPEPPHHHDVLNRDRERPVNLAPLWHIRDTDVALGTTPGDPNLPTCRVQNAGNHLEQRALSGTVGANDGNPLTELQAKRDVIERGCAVIAHRQLQNLQDRRVRNVHNGLDDPDLAQHSILPRDGLSVAPPPSSPHHTA